MSRAKTSTSGRMQIVDIETIRAEAVEFNGARGRARGRRGQRAQGMATLRHYPVGTRVRVHGRGSHGDWTGTVVPSSAGHITIRASNGREVTFFPDTLARFATVVGRVDSGTAHHRAQFASGKTNYQIGDRVRLRARHGGIPEDTGGRVSLIEGPTIFVAWDGPPFLTTRETVRSLRRAPARLPDTRGNRAAGKTAQYHAGSLNPWIWMGETPVVRSRNLRGLRDYAGKHVIRQISIARGPEHSGLLSVFFDNGAEFHDKFASYSVLQTFLREERNFQGAPFEVEGRDANVVMRDNPRLKNY